MSEEPSPQDLSSDLQSPSNPDSRNLQLKLFQNREEFNPSILEKNLSGKSVEDWYYQKKGKNRYSELEDDSKILVSVKNLDSSLLIKNADKNPSEDSRADPSSINTDSNISKLDYVNSNENSDRRYFTSSYDKEFQKGISNKSFEQEKYSSNKPRTRYDYNDSSIRQRNSSDSYRSYDNTYLKYNSYDYYDTKYSQKTDYYSKSSAQNYKDSDYYRNHKSSRYDENYYNYQEDIHASFPKRSSENPLSVTKNLDLLYIGPNSPSPTLKLNPTKSENFDSNSKSFTIPKSNPLYEDSLKDRKVAKGGNFSSFKDLSNSKKLTIGDIEMEEGEIDCLDDENTEYNPDFISTDKGISQPLESNIPDATNESPNKKKSSDMIKYGFEYDSNEPISYNSQVDDPYKLCYDIDKSSFNQETYNPDSLKPLSSAVTVSRSDIYIRKVYNNEIYDCKETLSNLSCKIKSDSPSYNNEGDRKNEYSYRKTSKGNFSTQNYEKEDFIFSPRKDRHLIPENEGHSYNINPKNLRNIAYSKEKENFSDLDLRHYPNQNSDFGLQVKSNFSDKKSIGIDANDIKNDAEAGYSSIFPESLSLNSLRDIETLPSIISSDKNILSKNGNDIKSISEIDQFLDNVNKNSDFTPKIPKETIYKTPENSKKCTSYYDSSIKPHSESLPKTSDKDRNSNFNDIQSLHEKKTFHNFSTKDEEVESIYKTPSRGSPSRSDKRSSRGDHFYHRDNKSNIDYSSSRYNYSRSSSKHDHSKSKADGPKSSRELYNYSTDVLSRDERTSNRDYRSIRHYHNDDSEYRYSKSRYMDDKYYGTYEKSSRYRYSDQYTTSDESYKYSFSGSSYRNYDEDYSRRRHDSNYDRDYALVRATDKYRDSRPRESLTELYREKERLRDRERSRRISRGDGSRLREGFRAEGKSGSLVESIVSGGDKVDDAKYFNGDDSFRRSFNRYNYPSDHVEKVSGISDTLNFDFPRNRYGAEKKRVRSPSPVEFSEKSNSESIFSNSSAAISSSITDSQNKRESDSNLPGGSSLKSTQPQVGDSELEPHSSNSNGFTNLVNSHIDLPIDPRTFSLEKLNKSQGSSVLKSDFHHSEKHIDESHNNIASLDPQSLPIDTVTKESTFSHKTETKQTINNFLANRYKNTDIFDVHDWVGKPTSNPNYNNIQVTDNLHDHLPSENRAVDIPKNYMSSSTDVEVLDSALKSKDIEASEINPSMPEISFVNLNRSPIASMTQNDSNNSVVMAISPGNSPSPKYLQDTSGSALPSTGEHDITNKSLKESLKKSTSAQLEIDTIHFSTTSSSSEIDTHSLKHESIESSNHLASDSHLVGIKISNQFVSQIQTPLNEDPSVGSLNDSIGPFDISNPQLFQSSLQKNITITQHKIISEISDDFPTDNNPNTSEYGKNGLGINEHDHLEDNIANTTLENNSNCTRDKFTEIDNSKSVSDYYYPKTFPRSNQNDKFYSEHPSSSASIFSKANIEGDSRSNKSNNYSSSPKIHDYGDYGYDNLRADYRSRINKSGNKHLDSSSYNFYTSESNTSGNSLYYSDKNTNNSYRKNQPKYWSHDNQKSQLNISSTSTSIAGSDNNTAPLSGEQINYTPNKSNYNYQRNYQSNYHHNSQHQGKHYENDYKTPDQAPNQSNFSGQPHVTNKVSSLDNKTHSQSTSSNFDSTTSPKINNDFHKNKEISEGHVNGAHVSTYNTSSWTPSHVSSDHQKSKDGSSEIYISTNKLSNSFSKNHSTSMGQSSSNRDSNYPKITASKDKLVADEEGSGKKAVNSDKFGSNSLNESKTFDSSSLSTDTQFVYPQIVPGNSDSSQIAEQLTRTLSKDTYTMSLETAKSNHSIDFMLRTCEKFSKDTENFETKMNNLISEENRLSSKSRKSAFDLALANWEVQRIEDRSNLAQQQLEKLESCVTL
ncbi:hypothetical protein AYI68_g1436 [Smittium mucronatum]|uniref:Uncharacterized protein n=1 Tax=Smittium mucronatum TaxID=133383 RepID=A0A1R0H5K4_9FUNG|nr:hypothetical protein AYI68_g1436 [Smittium mucronatum]